ncbi:MAG: prefoldin subunit beta [Nanoarchaeota archaeon]
MAEKQEKIQELQIIEQNLQAILIQKQAFQLEISETQSSLEELGKSSDEIFKVVGQIMFKTDKEKITEELKSKEKLLDLRLNSLEKQENSLKEGLIQLREEILRDNSKKK